jgi:hypothetical protein
VNRIGAGVATLAAIGAVGGALAWNQAQADAPSETAVTPLGAGAEAGSVVVPTQPAVAPDGRGSGEYGEYEGDDGRWYPEYEDDEHESRYEDDSAWDDDHRWEDEDDYEYRDQSAPAPAPSQPSSVAPSAPVAPSQGSTRTS